MIRSRLTHLGVAAAVAFAQASAHGLPASRVAVWTGAKWQTFWSAADAPATWTDGHPAVRQAVEWRAAGTGIETAELRISGSRSAWRLRLVLVRLDPRVLDFSLHAATRDAGLLGAWTVDSVPAGARVAFNAGQFDGGAPWGWQVHDGREVQPPGHGPLAMAVTIDRAGTVRLLHGAEVAEARSGGDVRLAFQSYPALLVGDGVVPAPLLAAGRGVDVAHRDIRFALGLDRQGRVLLALTRFDALGPAAGQVPFGPTTPEMAAIMGALGCARAVLLDGGLSAQLAVRADGGAMDTWRGMRRVPLGLSAAPRS